MPWVSSTHFRTTNLVDVNWTITVIITFDYRQSCWWRRVFLRQRAVVDADDRGGWTQIFGGKAYEPDTSRPVEKRNFYLFYRHFSEFCRDLLHYETRVPTYCAALFAKIKGGICHAVFEICERTDRQIDTHTRWSQYFAHLPGVK